MWIAYFFIAFVVVFRKMGDNCFAAVHLVQKLVILLIFDINQCFLVIIENILN